MEAYKIAHPCEIMLVILIVGYVVFKYHSKDLVISMRE